jgi:hypothetical protein
MASRMALLSAWILPSAAIEPEQSQIQMKCSGRVANSPPGLLGTLGSSFFGIQLNFAHR